MLFIIAFWLHGVSRKQETRHLIIYYVTFLKSSGHFRDFQDHIQFSCWPFIVLVRYFELLILKRTLKTLLVYNYNNLTRLSWNICDCKILKSYNSWWIFFKFKRKYFKIYYNINIRLFVAYNSGYYIMDV